MTFDDYKEQCKDDKKQICGKCKVQMGSTFYGVRCYFVGCLKKHHVPCRVPSMDDVQKMYCEEHWNKKYVLNGGMLSNSVVRRLAEMGKLIRIITDDESERYYFLASSCKKLLNA